MKFLILITALFSIPKVYAQTFDLKCRGPLALDFTKTPAKVTFVKATAAAGDSGGSLRPGECSWVDRRLSAEEPSTLQIGLPRPGCVQDPRNAHQNDVYWAVHAVTTVLQKQQLLQQSLLNKDLIVTLPVVNIGLIFASNDDQQFGCIGPASPLFKISGVK